MNFIKNCCLTNLSKIKTIIHKNFGKISISFSKENIYNPNQIKFKGKPKICVVYLVSPKNFFHELKNGKKINRIESLISSIKTTRNFLPPYKILIFHEDYSEKEINKVINRTSVKNIKFVKINFKIYKNKTNLENLFESDKEFVTGRPIGYRMMCRFFSGVLQNHEELNNFDYYIRMDDDSFFMKPKKLDVEKEILKHNFDFLYRSVWTDHKEKEKIWEFTKNYAKQNNLSLNNFKNLKMLNLNGTFNGRAAYNNFHISKISFWKRKDVKKFLQEIENIDGCIKLHWHDTNIHSMLMGLFNATIVEKKDFGYRHNIHYSLIGTMRLEVSPKNTKKDWIE